MNITCGVDIIEIERIKENIEKMGEAFLKKVFTDKEIEYCEKKKNQKHQSYAARFAAKEAVFKAISKNLKDKYSIGWKDVEILNDIQNRPFVNLYNYDTKTIKNIDISLSHCKDYAIANVVVEFC